MNKYYVRVGALYIKDIETNQCKVKTYFIEDIKLNCEPIWANKYTLEQAEKLVELLRTLGIEAYFEMVEESNKNE